MIRTFLILILAALAPSPAGAQVETPAKQAILMDFETGAVLFGKDADKRMPPASMSKLMTIYMVFERMKEGRLKPEDTFPVSETAWRMGGSKMFVHVGDNVRVIDLLRGIIVQSGNDACIVVAEGLSGSEQKFAEEMTVKGRQIGLTDSNFTNASGWPDPNHYTTARDLATLARRIIRDHPEHYLMFKEKEFTYAGIKQGNRNPLLYKNVGVDGLKTGHTEASGYGLVASAEREGRRLILVVNGLDSVNQRSAESERLLSLGFREYQTYALFKAGEPVANAEVWLGAEATVPLILEEPLTVALSRKSRQGLKVTALYDGPLAAPIAKGARLGVLRLEGPEMERLERPLIAGSEVEKLGPIGRIGAAIKYLVMGAPAS
jgi:serine-type D-Ala-D-Ala carboxypeptidase (penicillin-binding protein 5/6)